MNEFTFVKVVCTVDNLLLNILLCYILNGFVYDVVDNVNGGIVVGDASETVNKCSAPKVFRNFRIHVRVDTFFALGGVVVLLVVSLIG